MDNDFEILLIDVKFLCLTLTTLKYFCINHGNQRGFQFEIIINVSFSSSGSFEYLC